MSAFVRLAAHNCLKPAQNPIADFEAPSFDVRYSFCQNIVRTKYTKGGTALKEIREIV